MTNKVLLEHAEKLVADCSVPPHLSGFTFLTEAIVIKLECESIKLFDIYKTVAQNHNRTQRAVTRSISYALSQAEHISDYLSVKNQDVFNGRLFASLALKLKSMSNSDK